MDAILDKKIGQEDTQMATVSLAEAKAHLGALVKRAAAGEPVHILRRGKPVAQITAIATPRTPIDVTALRAMTDGMPAQTHGAGEFMREVRDSERY
jgi:prevent-host-death family protein